ncbi:hypothetical protein TNIN_493221 [Trichonephila inaurata madagascariensis]|uniref:Uncharacterized protein n=1 Tax=Trichonephila inaurata madagascariensis TaxID=2747483 RepID=A0A8X7CJC9_9ARAC|nr:hypothetical protein TNIN_493221 [Trichonephila inaurata madagascariensis]
MMQRMLNFVAELRIIRKERKLLEVSRSRIDCHARYSELRHFQNRSATQECRYFNNAFYLESNYAAPPTSYLTLMCFKDFRRVGDYKGNYMVEHVRLTHNSSVENNNYLGEWKGLNSRRRAQSTTDLPGGRLR